MRSLPPALAAALAGGTTTLAWCWRITRRDGTRFGFTDHDRDLSFDGTTFEAAAGLTATDIDTSAGLAVDNLELEGAITSERLVEADLAAGLYDDAEVEVFRVDWTDPANRILVRMGSIGEVKRSGSSFIVEVRGLAHRLQQPQGRLYQYSCDAVLGDDRCGIDLTLAAYRGAATVAALQGTRELLVTGLETFAADWFTRGLARFTSGANAGLSFEVRRHAVVAAQQVLELWQAMPGQITASDELLVTAGCDKQLATCRDRFANVLAFRGFPHLPGNDFVTAVARPKRSA